MRHTPLLLTQSQRVCIPHESARPSSSPTGLHPGDTPTAREDIQGRGSSPIIVAAAGLATQPCAELLYSLCFRLAHGQTAAPFSSYRHPSTPTSTHIDMASEQQMKNPLLVGRAIRAQLENEVPKDLPLERDFREDSDYTITDQ